MITKSHNPNRVYFEKPIFYSIVSTLLSSSSDNLFKKYFGLHMWINEQQQQKEMLLKSVFFSARGKKVFWVKPSALNKCIIFYVYLDIYNIPFLNNC
jgi:hypothetical protein